MKLSILAAQGRHTEGFTITEAIVSVAVVSLLILTAVQVYLAVESKRMSVERQAYASDLAYTNLQKVTSIPPGLIGLTPGDCTSYGMDSLTGGAGLDLTTAGFDYTLEMTDPSVVQVLGPGTTQALRAFAPNGCADVNLHPIKIESTVTYGTMGDKVVHATYVK